MTDNLTENATYEKSGMQKRSLNRKRDDYYSAAASSVEEAQKLAETGFKYVCTSNDVKLFRKRK